jgi:transposase
MIGRKKQHILFNPGTLVEYELPEKSFYAQLAKHRHELFRDEDFVCLYKASQYGRPSVPPAQLATLILLQYYCGVSDGETVERSGCDLRWAAALGRLPGPPLCDRTTLVIFRGRLVVHGMSDTLLDSAIQHARQLGILKGGKLQILIDTKPILGRGAAEDTFNLLARVMGRTLGTLADAAAEAVESWAEARGLDLYLPQRDSSLKGRADIDWHSPAEREKLLTRVVADARRLLQWGTELLPHLAEKPREALVTDLTLLAQILEQDVEEQEGPGGPPRAQIREGTAPDRQPSATDPDQRHGRKSASQRFKGHKARLAVDAETELILDVEVLAGNAGDAAQVLSQTERVEERTGTEVASTTGDCAFSGGETRRAYADAERVLHAKQPQVPAPALGFPKSKFIVLFEGEAVSSVTCPAGRTVTERKVQKDGTQIFRFGDRCRRCPLRHACVPAKLLKTGRAIHVNPEEKLLQEARAFQATQTGKALLRQRVRVEHALARLARVGIGQARYFGRVKTTFQLMMSAAVVNLRLIWNRAGAKGRKCASASPAAG